jgi:hypothetical protein
MIKEKILLIAGCSHTAGSEIDGNEDSVYNREYSYGGVIAKKLGRRAINIAQPGATNAGIARQVMFWFNDNYQSEAMDVNVLVGWSEATRMEIPTENKRDYSGSCSHTDWYDQSCDSYFKVIIGWNGAGQEEKLAIPLLHRFMVDNQKYLEVATYNTILQLQYFLQAKGIDYMFCNTMPFYCLTLNVKSDAIKNLAKLFDKTKYFKMNKGNEAFYIKYKELGHVNKKAKYWHHNEEPHMLFANELLEFNEINKCLTK